LSKAKSGTNLAAFPRISLTLNPGYEARGNRRKARIN
jgi:hypothetical protein